MQKGYEVMVFKTNMENSSFLNLVEQALSPLESIHKWNVDFDDIDRVLRIESRTNVARQVIQALNTEGLFCEELN